MELVQGFVGSARWATRQGGLQVAHVVRAPAALVLASDVVYYFFGSDQLHARWATSSLVRAPAALVLTSDVVDDFLGLVPRKVGCTARWATGHGGLHNVSNMGRTWCR